MIKPVNIILLISPFFSFLLPVYCDFTTKSEKGFKNHVQRKYTIKNMKYSQRTCDAVLKSESAQKLHIIVNLN